MTPTDTSERPTPGQIAYEADVAADPLYNDGVPRRTWGQLSELARSTWEKDPRPRRTLDALPYPRDKGE